MKKLILSFIFTSLLSCLSFSQERSDLLMKYITSPLNNEIEVYINFIDGKVNKDKPFTYYDITKQKQEISSKNLKKDFRLKLKKNEKINEDSYFITLNGFKEIQINANYSERSKSTTVFFKPQKAWYKINKIVFNYQDQKEKKLEKITIFSNQYITGDLKLFELKK
ncbi:MAG: hypothetical protein II304_12120 [Bacteroidales bacterium]|nr:hypothetical protein [Bacteroidales bacterium]